MKFSGLVFPAPNPPTYNGDRLVGEILYVPKDFNEFPYKYIQREEKVNEPVLNEWVSNNRAYASTPNLSSAQAKYFDHQGNLIINKEESVNLPAFDTHSSSSADYVPCLFLPCLKGSNKLIIFFHGNAEDLGISYEMLDHMRTAL